MTHPVPLDHLQHLPAHVTSVANPAAGKLIRLSFNEGAFGPSPLALAAYQAAIGALHRYPDLHYADLRQAIADHYQLDADRVVCGAGSDDLLNLLARGYAQPGDEIIHSQYGFFMFGTVAKLAGAVPVAVPEKNYTVDVTAVLAAVTPATRLIFIANPNNPTGSYIPLAELQRLHAGLPSRVLLVLDGAYAEYMHQPDYADGMALAATMPNVVVTRTFSKMHALGGLRIGWCYGSSAVTATLNRLRNPFNIALPAAAAAIASLGDTAFQQRNREHNTLWRDWLCQQLQGLGGFDPHPSVTNFVLVNVASAERATLLLDYLAAHGIQLRGMSSYRLPDHVRISIGREEEMRTLVEALKSFRAQEC
jgi:histidinol-phosphate aminotransferase